MIKVEGEVKAVAKVVAKVVGAMSLLMFIWFGWVLILRLVVEVTRFAWTLGGAWTWP